jgi:hypothetical protein
MTDGIAIELVAPEPVTAPPDAAGCGSSASTDTRAIGRSDVTRTNRAPSAPNTAPYVSPFRRCSPISSRPTSINGPKTTPSELSATWTRAFGLPAQWTATSRATSGNCRTSEPLSGPCTSAARGVALCASARRPTPDASARTPPADATRNARRLGAGLMNGRR